MGFISKHLILLSLLFYLASCVEGEQRVSVITDEGVSGPSPLSIIQTATPGSPPALPIPSNFAFTSPYCDPTTFCPGDVFPFLPDTSAILAVQISNPSNLPFTLEWSINNTVAYAEINPTQSSIPIGEPPPGATYTDYFSGLGFYTIVSSLKDSSGLLISNLVWSIEIVGTDPTYVTQSFSPRPAPTPYVGSPFSASDSSTQTISVTISNPSVTNFINNWYLDGALQNSSNQTGPATVSFSFVPSQMTTGNHTVVAQLTDDQAASPTIYNTSTWSFEVTELPQFSTFTNPQLPSPAPFADIEFGSTQTVNLDPNPLYNPSNANFTLYWEVDGAIDASATFSGSDNDDPPAFVISATDTNFSPGRHSVVALLFDESFGTSTLVDSVSWNFEVNFPPPATLDAVYPATSTQVISVAGIPMNGTSPMGGFFVGPSTDDSRGIPMKTTSTNTFCVEVSDGRGVGFPGPGTGVLVQYRYSDFARINATALQFPLIDTPPPLCLDGSGSATPTDGVPNFTLSALGDTFITATIIDKLSLQTIAVVNWNITVNVPNTQPTLVILAPFASTTTVATVPQDVTKTYSFTVLDQDCHPSLSKLNCYDSTFSMVNPIYPSPGVALNGTNTYYGGPGVVTPNCVRNYGYNGLDKFSCVIMVPSNNGTGPISASGTYQINAQVNNLSIWTNGTPTYVGTPTNYFGPPVTSDMLTWNLTVVEANTGGPVLVNQRASGPATPTTDSYMYIQGNPLAVASTATEGNSILFNFVVDDPQKDNYKIKYFYNTSSATATFTEFNATPTYTYSIADNPINGAIPASKTIAPFPLPFGLVTGPPSATITFKVQLTDVPDSASPITNSFNFYINVTNVNPPPVAVTGTEKPPFTATGTVVQGFPYTMEINITDASVGLGSGLKWQWMINQNVPADCASITAASWKKITGATEGGTPLPAPQTATLTWSAPSDPTIPATATFCFRNCIGDNDFPGLNTTNNCSPAIAGPWVGPIKGVPADIPSVATTGYLQPNMGDTAVWADPGNVGDIYGIHLRGNSIFLMKYDYQLDGTVIQSNGSFPTRPGQTATTTVNEGAYDVSMTGNNQFIFVSYVFNNPSFFPPFVSVPTNMVVKITKANFSLFYYFINDKVPADVGQVVANNSAFWVPFANSSLSDTPFFFGGDGFSVATTTVNGSFGLAFTVEDIQSREQGGILYMALKLNDGTVNLYTYTMPALPATPTIQTTSSDIFYSYYVPFTDMSLAVGPATNPNIFVAGIDGTTKGIFYGVRPIVGGAWVVEDLSVATATYPTYDPQGLNAVASTNPGEVLLGFIRKETFFRAPFLDLYILKSDGTNPPNLSKRININRLDLSSPKLFGSPDFALTNVAPDFVIGTAGADPNENKKDTLWFRYWDFSSDRMVIINIEDETFSGSTPTSGNAWSTPWFQQ